MQTIGQRIKKRREFKKLSIREVARKIGLSASFISQVENGKSFPSLAVLKQIANVLEITAGELMQESIAVKEVPHDDIVQRKKTRRYFKDLANGIELFYLSSEKACDTYKQMEPVLVILKENACSGNEQYNHFGQEFYLVTRGKLEFIIGKNKYVLNKGDSIYFNSKEQHFFRNIYKGVSKAFYVTTPPMY